MGRPLRNERDHWPCGDYPDGKCPKRQPGCQDKCPEMIAAKLEAEARRRKVRAARAVDLEAEGAKANGIERCSRHRGRQT